MGLGASSGSAPFMFLERDLHKLGREGWISNLGTETIMEPIPPPPAWLVPG